MLAAQINIDKYQVVIYEKKKTVTSNNYDWFRKTTYLEIYSCLGSFYWFGKPYEFKPNNNPPPGAYDVDKAMKLVKPKEYEVFIGK